MSLSRTQASMVVVLVTLCALPLGANPSTQTATSTTAPAQTQSQVATPAWPHPFFGDQLNRLITLTFGIAAFLATFYVLLRNNPWLRPEAGSVFYAIAASIVGGVALFFASLTWLLSEGTCWNLVRLGVTLVGTTLILFVRVFWKSYVRMNYLHEGKGSWKFFIIPRLWRRILPERKTYEFKVEARREWTRDTSGVVGELRDTAFERLGKGGSLLITSPAIGELREDLFKFIARRLTAGDTVNYVTIVEAPFQIVSGLKAHLSSIPADRFVFVDVFSRTFGFRDDILEEVSKQVKETGVRTIQARTVGGLHRALKVAFNYIKKDQGDRKERLPCVMVYDCLSALALADSEDQLCVFLHHMIPAERSYRMATILIEHSGCREPMKSVIESLVDSVIRKSDSCPPEGKDSATSNDETPKKEAT